MAWHGRGGHGLSTVQAFVEVAHNPNASSDVVATTVVLAFVVQGWMIFHLLRQHGRLLVRIDVLEAVLQESGLFTAADGHVPTGLSVGAAAPPFELALLSGGTITLERLRESSSTVLLIFSDPDCEPCNALLPQIAPPGNVRKPV